MCRARLPAPWRAVGHFSRADPGQFPRASKELKTRGIKAVIHSKPERKWALPLDRKLYRIRYLVEVCFHELKRLRAIGTRYYKTKASLLALLQVACICLWLNLGTRPP